MKRVDRVGEDTGTNVKRLSLPLSTTRQSKIPGRRALGAPLWGSPEVLARQAFFSQGLPGLAPAAVQAGVYTV